MRHSALLSAVSASVDAIVHIDCEGKILNWNAAAAQMFDYPCSEIVGRHVVDLVVDDHRGAQLQVLQDVLGGARVTPFDTVCMRRNGSVVQTSWALSPVRDSSGNISGAAAIIRDITQRVRETAQVVQRQRLEAVGRLAGSIAHDFNNLLMAILGHADLGMESLPEGHPARDDFAQIASTVNSASELTQQLLTFSRERAFSPRSVYVSEVVTKVVALLQRLIPEHTRVEVDDRSGGAVRIDPSELEQVVVNIAVNASDAMPTGGVLSIETADVTQSGTGEVPRGEYVVVRMSDTGVGMTEEQRNRAFDPYFTTKGEEWAGMGLSVAYGIIGRADGCILIRSRKGGGTVVEVWIPRTTPSGRVRAQRPPRGSRSRSPTVLIVEDDPSVRAVAVRILRQLGFEVLDAPNGAEALDLIDRHGGDIDLALTDVVMPVMGGHEFIHHLRQRCPDTRVLMMSGYRGNDEDHELVGTEDVKFLRKPFSADSLRKVVVEALGE